MRGILLSIDWDYFIPIPRKWIGSYTENTTNMIKSWYRRYFKSECEGKDLEKKIGTGNNLQGFWKRIDKWFNISKKVPIYISDSHKISYFLAKKYGCKEVYSFDAHSDLGYGGLDSLKFEVNCANWLGKLLDNYIIQKAHIIYSPYSYEYKNEFNEINHHFNIRYNDLDQIKKKPIVGMIHICRSGAWTPPWLDKEFESFINQLNQPFRLIDYTKRNWCPKKATLAYKIDALLG